MSVMKSKLVLLWYWQMKSLYSSLYSKKKIIQKFLINWFQDLQLKEEVVLFPGLVDIDQLEDVGVFHPGKERWTNS